MNIFRSIWQDLRSEMSGGSTLSRLMIINVAVFVVLSLLRVFIGNAWPGVYSGIIHNLAIPGDPLLLLQKPWTIFTSFFVHEGLWHILWNMLLFYWFGRIMSDLIGDKKILPVYILGGLAGSTIFFLSAQFLPNVSADSYAYGASAAVMATIVASGVLAPEYQMRLILIGNVRLKYIVAVLVFLDILGAGGNVNSGGHLAHLGGAVMGYFYIASLRRGRNIGAWVEWLEEYLSGLFRARSGGGHMTVSHRSEKFRGNRRGGRFGGRQKDSKPGSLEAEVDRILVKIKESGMESLTDSERETLYLASKDKKGKV